MLINLLFTALFSVAADSSWNFVALGDTGKANEGQHQVGQAISEDCRKNLCDFGVLLGDNFYEVGVTSVQDPQWRDKFEIPYQDFPKDFYVILGNHDYGKYAKDWDRGQHQLDYGKQNPKWKMPNFYYSFSHKNILFIALDTSRLFHNKDTEAQIQFVKNTLAKRKEKWVIVLAHHPYISNGKHGNAGSYDGVPFPPYNGKHVKELFEKELCGVANLVLHGHDHSLQVLPGTKNCTKPYFVVSGSGSSASKDLGSKNAFLFQSAEIGYTTVEVSEEHLTVRHKNADGQVLFSKNISP